MESTTTSTYTTETTNKNVARNAVVNALAAVGFLALLVLGISLAIYSARYLPSAFSQLDTFGGSPTPNTLSAVSATSTLPVGPSDLVYATSTTTLTPPATTTAEYIPPADTTAVATAPATPKKPALYGLPDLSTTIIATGYLTTTSTDSFVAASVIPPGARPAVQFSIANDGTNSTGPWSFLAELPTENGSTFNSPVEENLNPGDHIVFTLGFNEAIPGPAQTVTIVADPNDQIVESNEGNNSASAAMTITATGN